MRAHIFNESDTKVATAGREIRYYRVNIHADEDVKDVLRMLKKDGMNWSQALAMLIEIGAKAYDRIGGYNIEGDNERVRKRRVKE